MDFVKKNMVLVIVLAITFVICAALLFLVFQKHGELSKSIKQVVDIRGEIETLIKQSPAPLKENLERINDDIRIMKEKAEEINMIFGQPYRTALQAFAAEVGMNESELLAKFREFWGKEAKRGSNRYQLLFKFKKEFEPPKWAKAVDAFMKAAQKETAEPLDDTNIEDLFMASLGLPRVMSNMNCKTYMISKMQPNLVKMLEESPGVICTDVSKFSFEEFDNKMPLEDHIPYILRHWTVIDDLVRRIKVSGINSFDNLTKINGLNGELDREFLKFRYSITVTGSQDSIRTLVDSMMNAYKSNRVYIIKNMSLEKVLNEVKEITDPRDPNRPRGAFIPGIMQPGAPLIPEAAAAEENLPMEKRKDYGIILFGNDKTVKAIIEFEYVIYIANEYRI